MAVPPIIAFLIDFPFQKLVALLLFYQAFEVHCL